jgi:acetoin utilization deacetylase AcuC-like enzyme
MNFLADISLNGLVTPQFYRDNPLESPERVKEIKKHLEQFPEEFPITTITEDFGLDPILGVHDADYIHYLQSIFQEW